MLFIDALVRFSAATMLVLLALTAVRDLRTTRSWPYLALASLSTAALFLSLSSPELAPPRPIALILGFFDIPHLVLVWLFSLAVFQTKFSLKLHHVVLGAVYTIPIFWFRAFQFNFLEQPPFALSIAVSIGSIAMMGHLIFVVLKERDLDLLRDRKNARIWFVIVLASLTAITAVVDLYLISAWPDWASLMKAVTIWPGVLAATVWILRADSKRIFVPSSAHQRSRAGDTDIPHSDLPLLRSLQSSISNDHIYLDPKLSISRLAQHLGTNEHRLRRLINQGLGYENFNQFLNSKRVEAVIEKFKIRDCDNVPILTIALESGFSSLSPFNKAFKDAMGQTPSQYRKTLKAHALQTEEDA